MEKFKIERVEIVKGNVLESNWKSPMQIIYTDKGIFIDNMPNKQFGHWKSGCKGYDWFSYIGETVENVEITRLPNYNWLQKH